MYSSDGLSVTRTRSSRSSASAVAGSSLSSATAVSVSSRPRRQPDRPAQHRDALVERAVELLGRLGQQLDAGADVARERGGVGEQRPRLAQRGQRGSLRGRRLGDRLAERRARRVEARPAVVSARSSAEPPSAATEASSPGQAVGRDDAAGAARSPVRSRCAPRARRPSSSAGASASRRLKSAPRPAKAGADAVEHLAQCTPAARVEGVDDLVELDDRLRGLAAASSCPPRSPRRRCPAVSSRYFRPSGDRGRTVTVESAGSGSSVLTARPRARRPGRSRRPRARRR